MGGHRVEVAKKSGVDEAGALTVIEEAVVKFRATVD